MDNSDNKLNRREFLQKSAVVAAGSAALSSTALSSRIAGANDRISLGHIGIGNRGSELDGIVARLKDSKNVEMTAVCDLWSHNLDRAVAANEKRYGKAPRAFKHPQELLALKDFKTGRNNCAAQGWSLFSVPICYPIFALTGMRLRTRKRDHPPARPCPSNRDHYSRRSGQLAVLPRFLFESESYARVFEPFPNMGLFDIARSRQSRGGFQFLLRS